MASCVDYSVETLEVEGLDDDLEFGHDQDFPHVGVVAVGKLNGHVSTLPYQNEH